MSVKGFKNHPYIPNSVPEVEDAMLKEIGVASLEDLHAEVPDEIILKDLMNIPPAFGSEYELARHVKGLLKKNSSCEDNLNFLGAGCYQHYVPAICDEINGKGEFLTAYGGESYNDFGRFQALFEFESLVAELVDMPRLQEKPVTYLEKEEVRDVLQGAETGSSLTKKQYKFSKGQQMRDIAILTLLLNTGIRVSEMVGIDLQDIDWNERRIRVFRMGRKEQYVYFNEPVQEALEDYINYERKSDSDDLNALFISRKGQRITVRSVERMVKKYTASVVPAKNITPHKLRSTFATNLYEETGDIYVTADALGHASMQTVKKYTNLSDERRRKAAEAIEKAYYED